MMKGSETSDAIESLKIFETIRVNPNIEKVFEPMDKAEPAHLSNFKSYADMFVETHTPLWQHITQCLSSRDVQSDACFQARSESYKEFGQDFHLLGLDSIVGSD